MTNNLIHAGERLDDLQLDGLKIIQDPKQYCFTSDAVTLANFVRTKKKDAVLDLCSGSGIVGILVYAKTKPKSMTLLELQPQLANMAERSVEYNGLSEQIKVVNDSVQNSVKRFGHESFSAICCNPPYKTISGHKLSQNDEINICKYELKLNIEELIEAVSKLLIFGGKFYFIHESSRLTDLITTLKKYHLEPKRIQFVYPKAEMHSNVVLIEAEKRAQSGIIVEPSKIIEKER